MAAGGFALVAWATALLPRPLHAARRKAPDPTTVATVAAMAAVVAWFAPTAPTGVTGLDHLLRSGAVVGIVLLAARASATALAAGSVLVAAGAAGSGWAVALPAGMAAGLAVGMAVTDRGPWDVRVVVGGIVAVCSFHLTWPSAVNATAALAVAAVLVLVVSGIVHLGADERRTVVMGGIVAFAAAALATALGFVAAVQARQDLEAGAARARAGLEAARRGDVVEATRSLEAARASFVDARRDLRAWWARPALAVPVVAHQSRALSTLASTGADIAGVGGRLADVSDPGTFRVAGGTVPIERVRALLDPAEEASHVLARKGRELERAGAPWLAPPVRREIDRLTPRVQRAARDAGVVARTVRLAPGLLGADGPRRWFLAVQSSAELRATGGFIGSFAEIGADGGRLRLERVGRIADLNTGGAGRKLAAPPEYLARYGRFDPHLLWQNVNMSPDFPTVAGVIANLYPQSGGGPVDGVVAVDPSGLAAILRAVGPVRVADWPEPITADTAVRVLLHEQYVRFPQTGERVDFLGHVTEAVWQRVVDGSVGIVDLGRVLVDALDEKHVVLTSTRPEEQQVLAGLRVTGAMAPVEDDFLAVVTQNAGGNKIDWYLRRAVDYRVDVDAKTGRMQARARITLRNEAPADGLPPYVIGSARRPPPLSGTNSVYLSVYTPWALQRATVDGQPTGLESEQELGRRVYSAFVDVPPGGSVVVEVVLAGTRIGTGRQYRVTVHRQPTVTPDDVRVSVGGQAERMELERDRTLSFRLPRR